MNDPLGPLGPVGGNNNNNANNDASDVGASHGDPRPAPPDKEVSGSRSLREQQQPPSTPQISTSRSTLDSTDLDNDGEVSTRAAKIPPPVLSPSPSSPPPQRQTKPSMPIEQAAHPKFDISVGDPHKVGDLTSSHIVYQVRTKVCFTWFFFREPSTDRGIDEHRRHPRHTKSPNSPSVAATATSCGYTISFTATIQASWSRLHRRNKPWDDSMRISSNPVERHWNAC